MSSKEEDDLLAALLEQNFMLAEKISVLTNQIAVLRNIIQWRDVVLYKNGRGTGASLSRLKGRS